MSSRVPVYTSRGTPDSPAPALVSPGIKHTPPANLLSHPFKTGEIPTGFPENESGSRQDCNPEIVAMEAIVASICFYFFLRNFRMALSLQTLHGQEDVAFLEGGEAE